MIEFILEYGTVLLVLLVLIIGVFINWLLFRRSVKRRKLVDSGKVCLYCESTDVRGDFAGVVCNSCGQTTSQELLDAAGPSEDELRDIFRMSGE
ncbi:MAG: hypothetical protein ACI9KE_001942 [Polyangiales bacterium]